VEVTIQKVDVLRHQIDLAVVLPEGYEEYNPEGSDQRGEQSESVNDSTSSEHEE